MVTLASLVVLGLVLGTLVGAVVLTIPTPVTAGGANLQASTAGFPSGTHGACVVSAVRQALMSRNPGTGIGFLVSAMARRC